MGRAVQVHRLKSIIKPEFATVRQLEMKGYGLFKWAGIIGAVSLGVSLFMPYLLPLSGPGMVVAAGMFLLGMVWISVLGKDPSRHVFCPYCASKNDVFVTRREANCDICGRLMRISEAGVPVAIEGEQVEHKQY